MQATKATRNSESKQLPIGVPLGSRSVAYPVFVSISAPDSNLLWALSRGLCAFPLCDAELVIERKGQYVTNGQRAHIRSDVPGGPRHDSNYPNPDGYGNLLLLCLPHHNEIDALPGLYPVELLLEWKRAHEVGHSSADLLTVAPPVAIRHCRRERLLRQLCEALERTQIVALTGLPGVGKNQLALDHFHATANEYKFRAWVRAGDHDGCIDDFAAIGALFGLLRTTNEATSNYCQRVRECLEEDRGWLIVFDDAPNTADIDVLVPRKGGHVVITSKAQAWFCGKIDVGPLDRTESIGLLSQAQALSGSDEVALNTLAATAADLPLCIAQIIGYAEETGMSAERMTGLIANNISSLLGRGAPPDHVEMRSCLEESVRQVTPFARDLLAAMSVLGSTPIPVLNIDLGSLWVGTSETIDSLAVEDAVASLRRFSLIERDGSLLSAHEIVQIHVVQQLNLEERNLAIWRAIGLVGALLPERVDRHDHLPAAMQLMPHVNSLMRYVSSNTDLCELLALILNRIIPAFFLLGDTDRAEEGFRRRLELLEIAGLDQFGSRPSLLTNLANCMADRGDYDQAISLATDALEMKQAGKFAAESVGITMGALGCLYESTGDFQTAHQLFEGALPLRADASSRDRADAMNDVARIKRLLGDTEGAMHFNQQAVETVRNEPADWSELARAYLNLSSLNEESGNLNVAFEYLDAAIQVCEQCAVPTQELAECKGTRGRLRCGQGDFAGLADIADSLAFFEEFQAGSENAAKALGNRGVWRVNLGLAVGERSLLASGLSDLRLSLQMLKKLLPADHETVLTAAVMLKDSADSVWR